MKEINMLTTFAIAIFIAFNGVAAKPSLGDDSMNNVCHNLEEHDAVECLRKIDEWTKAPWILSWKKKNVDEFLPAMAVLENVCAANGYTPGREPPEEEHGTVVTATCFKAALSLRKRNDHETCMIYNMCPEGKPCTCLEEKSLGVMRLEAGAAAWEAEAKKSTGDGVDFGKVPAVIAWVKKAGEPEAVVAPPPVAAISALPTAAAFVDAGFAVSNSSVGARTLTQVLERKFTTTAAIARVFSNSTGGVPGTTVSFVLEVTLRPGISLTKANIQEPVLAVFGNTDVAAGINRGMGQATRSGWAFQPAPSVTCTSTMVLASGGNVGGITVECSNPGS